MTRKCQHATPDDGGNALGLGIFILVVILGTVAILNLGCTKVEEKESIYGYQLVDRDFVCYKHYDKEL